MSEQHRAPHRWQPGQSGNPRGRPRKGNALTEIVRADADPREMVSRALEIMRGDDDARALTALQWLRDSGYTKPAERTEIALGTADDDGEDLSGLSIEQLRELDAAAHAYDAARATILALPTGVVPVGVGAK